MTNLPLTTGDAASSATMGRRSRHHVILVCLLAVLVVFQYSISPYPPGWNDPLLQDLATSVADGRGYSGCNALYFFNCQESAPSAARPPLPVLFYAGYQVLSQQLQLQFLVYIHILFNVLTGILLYATAGKVFRDARVGLIVVAVWATYLPMARFVGYYRMDILLAFLLTLTLYLLMRAVEKPACGRFLLVGLAFGLTLVTRAVFLYTIFLLPVGLYFALGRDLRRTLRHMGVVVLGISIFLLPWVLRNYQAFGAFVPGSTLNGYNLLRHNQIIQDDDYLRYAHSGETQEYIQQFLGQRDDLRGDENEAELDRIYAAEALRIIRQYPLRYLHLVLHRFLVFQWFDVEIAENYGYDSSGFYTYALVFNLFTLLTAAIGIVRLPRQQWRLGWLLLAPVVYLALIHPLVVTMLRYIAGVMPYLLMFSVYGLVSVVFPRDRQAGYWRIGLVGMGIALWAVWIGGYVAQSAPVQSRSASDIDVAYYDGDLRLLGYDLDRDQYQPGDSVRLSLYFDTPTQLDQEIGISVHILDPDFESIAHQNVLLQTDAWGTSQTVVQPVSIDLPEDIVTPVADHIQLSMYAFTEGYPSAEIDIALSDSDLRLLTPDTLLLADVPILAETTSGPLAYPATYQIADAFSLSSYDLPAAVTGSAMTLAFQWTVDAAVHLDATQFVHLLDMNDGHLVQGFDAQPFNGDFPTRAWVAGTQMIDTWQLDLPDTLAPGSYQIVTGFYDPLTLARLPVTLDGQPVLNNLIDLGTVTIAPST